MAETKSCEQCGTTFVPRREHARFCSVQCRVACNRDNGGDRSAEMSALDWSAAAMREATGRLSRGQPWDQARAAGTVNDAVWWVTIVDATLVRYHAEAYDSVLAGQSAADRKLVEDTLAGLRFVRNRMGQADFIRPQPGRAAPGGGIAAWIWNSVPKPRLASLPPRSRTWEMTRYRAYEAQLADHAVGETFGRAAAFLRLAVAKALPVTDAGVRTAP